MNKTKYKILFIFTLSGIAVMTACGNTTESSAAPTPANSLLCSVKALNKVKLRWTMIVSQNLISAI